MSDRADLLGRDVHNPLRRLVVHLLRKHLGEDPLVRRQVLGHVDAVLHLQVASASPSVQLLHAHARQGDPVARVGTRRDLDLDLARERWDRDLATEDRRRQRDASGVEDVRAGPAELGVGRDPDEHVEIALLRPDVLLRGLARGRRVSGAVDSQAHSVLDARGNVHVDRLPLPHNSVSGARPARGSPRDGRAAPTARAARRRHLEPALDHVHPGTRPAADAARRALRPGLHAVPGAGPAGDVGIYRDLLPSAHGGVHERDVGLHLDVIAHEDLLLERVPPRLPPERAAAARKGGEDIVEVDAAAAEAAAAATEAGERVPAAERITARARPAAGVEAGGAELVVLLALLGVREHLVGRLDLAELVLRGGVLVRVGVELLREAVVRLLDVAGARRLVDAEGLVGVLDRGEGIRRVERLKLACQQVGDGKKGVADAAAYDTHSLRDGFLVHRLPVPRAALPGSRDAASLPSMMEAILHSLYLGSSARRALRQQPPRERRLRYQARIHRGFPFFIWCSRKVWRRGGVGILSNRTELFQNLSKGRPVIGRQA